VGQLLAENFNRPTCGIHHITLNCTRLRDKLGAAMTKKFPIHPNHPERICWGCDQFCATDAMACSNERSPHPMELFGKDCLAWGDHQFTPAPNEAIQDQTLELDRIPANRCAT
jgi:hypothetical protein